MGIVEQCWFNNVMLPTGNGKALYSIPPLYTVCTKCTKLVLPTDGLADAYRCTVHTFADLNDLTSSTRASFREVRSISKECPNVLIVPYNLHHSSGKAV